MKKNKIKTVNQRLIEIVKFLKAKDFIYNETDFCKKTGIGRSFLSDMKSSGKAISGKTISKITARFPMISESWFLTGEGEMLKPEKNTLTLAKYDLKKPEERLFALRELEERFLALQASLREEELLDDVIGQQVKKLNQLLQYIKNQDRKLQRLTKKSEELAKEVERLKADKK